MEACDATTYARHKKCEIGIETCKIDEFLHVRSYLFGTTMHCGNAVGLSLKSHSLSPYRSKPVVGCFCGTTSMAPLQVTPENKDLVLLQVGDKIRCYSIVVHSCILGLYISAAVMPQAFFISMQYSILPKSPSALLVPKVNLRPASFAF